MIVDFQDAFEAIARSEDARSRVIPKDALHTVLENHERAFRQAYGAAEISLGNGKPEQIEELATKKFLVGVCGANFDYVTVKSDFKDLEEMDFRGEIVAAANGKVFQRVGDDSSFAAHQATDKLNGQSLGKVMDVNYGATSEAGLQRTMKAVHNWDGYYIEHDHSQQAKAQRAEMKRSAGMSI